MPQNADIRANVSQIQDLRLQLERMERVNHAQGSLIALLQT